MLRDLEITLKNARQRLLAERHPSGHWEGELSSSALSTATAIVALQVVEPNAEALIEGGRQWLIDHQNADGGWGDTVLSHSNISTTLLCWSALHFCGDPETALSSIERANAWIEKTAGSLDPAALTRTVVARYGKDRTFSVPILMLCAICGRLGEDKEGWKRVLPLPFEVAAVPRKWFATLRLPVVSYALPALIAIGYARYFHAPPRLKPWRQLRQLAWPKASAMLAAIQPESGGFLEATPLTSFVTMALGSSDQAQHPVVPHAVRFLKASVRPDGSWPIDTDLATWGTTLSVKALTARTTDPEDFPMADRERIRQWLLDQQYREIHPFTDAKPGGWAWTNLTGGVPDGDDTPGALLALRQLDIDPATEKSREAAIAGVTWLLDLQNGDGGIPTFCRGWGALPFDRSSTDLTAHTLRAWHQWKHDLPRPLQTRVRHAMGEALTYLTSQQDAEGAWTPLWFGNQHVANETNRTYATSLVLHALLTLNLADFRNAPSIDRAMDWLIKAQNENGGWGGDLRTSPSIEETALAVTALAMAPFPEAKQAAQKGTAFLIEKTEKGHTFPPSPIGFYFAKLWYYEKLYPLIWTVEALETGLGNGWENAV